MEVALQPGLHVADLATYGRAGRHVFQQRRATENSYRGHHDVVNLSPLDPSCCCQRTLKLDTGIAAHVPQLWDLGEGLSILRTGNLGSSICPSCLWLGGLDHVLSHVKPRRPCHAKVYTTQYWHLPVQARHPRIGKACSKSKFQEPEPDCMLSGPVQTHPNGSFAREL